MSSASIRQDPGHTMSPKGPAALKSPSQSPTRTGTIDALPPLTHLASQESVDELLNNVDYFFMDCDGVCYLNHTAIPGAAETIEALRAKGKKVIYATNNGRVTRMQIVDSLTAIGFKASIDEVMCTTWAAGVYLKKLNFSGKVYLVAEAGMAEELEAAGIRTVGLGPDPTCDVSTLQLDPEVKAVMLSLDFDLSMAKLVKLVSYVNHIDEASGLYMTTNPDRAMPLRRKDILVPDTGCTAEYVRFATGKSPTLIGKPNKYFFECVTHGLNMPDLDPKRVAMVGDQYLTDIMFAKNNGFGASVLVDSGVDKIDQLHLFPQARPTHHVAKLADLLPFLN